MQLVDVNQLYFTKTNKAEDTKAIIERKKSESPINKILNKYEEPTTLKV